MTSSVRYFTSEIEKHEQELLHSHENLEKQVAERTCELKALSEKLLMAQESERFKLASELHDNIGATLGAIKFGMERSLRSIRSLPEHELQPDICDTLSTSVSLVKKLATHLRRIQNELRPPQLELGLEATIADFCEEYERVSLGMDGDALRLVISDDGKGFSVAEKLADVSVKSGLGLKSLRERAQLSSGVLTIGSELGRGTIIAVVWDAAALRG